MAVGGVEHEHVDAGLDEGRRLRGDVAVDADRGGDAQAAARVDGRRVEGRAQGAAPTEGADDHAVMTDEREFESRVHHQVEGRARAVEVVGVERGHGAVDEVAEAGVGKRGSESRRGDASVLLPGGGAQHDAVPVDRRNQAQRLRHGGARRQDERRIPGDRLVFDPADGGVQFLQRQVLRKHAESAASGQGRREPRTGDRVHVGRHDRDGRAAAVAGREVDVEAAGDRRAVRNQEYVRVRQLMGGRGPRESHASTVDVLRTKVPDTPERGVGTARPGALSLTLVPYHREEIESGRSAVSNPVTGVAPEDGTSGEFGANEWLVDEMYERYLVDKNSVDKSWWPILESYRPGRRPDADPGDPPPRRRGAGSRARAAAAGPAPQSPPPPPSPPRRPARRPSPARPRSPRSPSRSRRRRPRPARPPSPRARSRPPSPRRPSSQLKGMSKTLAANMEASLTVPTATSVRTIPAKLMIDNRIVINNHLRRARGGKVSFTHLIGWAIVQTLKEFPSQNVFYDEPDGKPSVVAPPHVTLGIAIDLPEARRHPLAAGSGHQARRHDDLPRVPRHLRGCRGPRARQQADRRRLPGRDDLAHQPGRHRNRALGAPAHARPGMHHRRRGARIPGRLPGRRRRRPSPSSASARPSRSPAPTTTASSRAPDRASSSRRCTSA